MNLLLFFVGASVAVFAILGCTFLLGRQYEKRQWLKRMVRVSAGTVRIAGEERDLPVGSVPLGSIIQTTGKSSTVYIRRDPWRGNPWTSQ